MVDIQRSIDCIVSCTATSMSVVIVVVGDIAVASGVVVVMDVVAATTTPMMINKHVVGESCDAVFP